jgi:solute carrier family 7 (L-type amino acid transporter), member 6
MQNCHSTAISGGYSQVPTTDDSPTPESHNTTVSTGPQSLYAAPTSAENRHDGRPSSSLRVSSEGVQGLEASPEPSKSSLTFINGLALVTGLQIGSGIFAAPSQVSQHVPSPGMGVLAWFVGGLLVWTGAASFIELGLAIPKNGGVQEYLQFCYGDFLGFLFTWIWVGIAKSSAMAMVAMVFSDYLCRAILPPSWISLILSKFVALSGLAVITFINCLGSRTGALVANGFLVLKIFAIISIAFLGFGLAFRQGSVHPSPNSDGWFGGDDRPGNRNGWAILGDYVTAIFGVLFSYGGWETVGSYYFFAYRS